MYGRKTTDEVQEASEAKETRVSRATDRLTEAITTVWSQNNDNNSIDRVAIKMIISESRAC